MQDPILGLILSELQRLNRNIEAIGDRVNATERKLDVIEVKSGLIGTVSGTLSVIVAFFIESFIRKS